MDRAAPFLVLLVGVLAASSSSILVRYAQQEGIASLAIAAWRMVLAMVVLLPLAVTARRAELRGLNLRDGLVAALAGLFLAAHFLAWITSLEYTSVASSAALVTTNPIWVGLACVLIFRERLPRQTLAGIVISLIGCLLILWADLGSVASLPSTELAGMSGTMGVTGRQPELGNGLALLGALCVSAYLLTGRSLASRFSLLTYITLVYGASAVLLVVAAVLAGVELWRYTAFGWSMLAGLAFGPQLIGHTAFNWALRRLSATFVALAILGEPVGSAILAAFLFVEVPSPLQLVAFTILLIGIVVAALGERPPSAAPNPRPSVSRPRRASPR